MHSCTAINVVIRAPNRFNCRQASCLTWIRKIENGILKMLARKSSTESISKISRWCFHGFFHHPAQVASEARRLVAAAATFALAPSWDDWDDMGPKWMGFTFQALEVTPKMLGGSGRIFLKADSRTWMVQK